MAEYDHFSLKQTLLSPPESTDTKFPKPLEKLLGSISPKRKSTKSTSNWVQTMFFTWVNPIFDIGNKRSISPSDLFTIGDYKKIQTIGKNFEIFRDRYIKKNPSAPNRVLYLIYRMIRKSYIWAVIILLTTSALQMVAPILFNEYYHRFSHTYKEGTKDLNMPLAFIGFLTLDLFIRAIVVNHSVLHINNNSSIVSKSLNYKIFDKMIKMNLVHLDYFVETTIVNLIMVDVPNITGGLNIIPNFLAAALVLTAQFSYLYSLGYYSFILAGLLLLVVQIYKVIYQRSADSRKKHSLQNDKASSSLKDLIINITNAKLNNFENMLERKLEKQKKREHKFHHQVLIWTHTANILNFIFPTLFGFLYFGLIIGFSRENDVSLAETYIILSVLSILRTPLTLINDAFEKYYSYVTSRKRVEDFLNYTLEKKENCLANDQCLPGEIQLREAYFQFNLPFQIRPAPSEDMLQKTEILMDISLDIKPGSKVCFIGPPGSGKTFLLQSLLSETQLTRGKANINGTVSYIPEDNHFVEDSIFQNILCGRDLDIDRYEECIKIVKLKDRLDKVHHQESLILKGNATNLYYKLRKRIVLARVLYSPTDIILFDGFFDDMDSDYRQYVIKEIIMKHLRDKTVLICTDRSDVCLLVEQVVVMKGGRIVQEGKCKDLVSDRDSLFSVIMSTGSKSTTNDMFDPATGPKIDPVSEKSNVMVKEDQKEIDGLTQQIAPNSYETKRYSRHWRVIFSGFFLSSGISLFFIYLLLLILSQSITYASTWYVASWKNNKLGLKPYDYLSVYAAITVSAIVALIIKSIVFTRYFHKITHRLYLKIVRSIPNKSLHWFRENSSSRILNVFITDYHDIDEHMGDSVNSFMQYLIRLRVGLLIIVYGSWITGAAMVVLHLLITRTFVKWLRTARDLKQIMVDNRSHVVTSIMDIHNGLLHYRNSGIIKYLQTNFFDLYNIYHNSKSTDTNYGHRWLSTRILTYHVFYPILVLLDAVLEVYVGWEVDLMLLSIKFAIALDMCFSALSLLSYFIKNETYFSNVERIIEYSEGGSAKDFINSKWNDLNKESETTNENLVEFKDVYAYYPGMSIVALRGISFTIKEGDKVAFVGGSGSGKHTTLDIMTGLSESARQFQGQIKILGHQLKPGFTEEQGQSVVYLSGEFGLFEGTLWDNIDPSRHKFSSELIIEMFEYLGYWDTPDSYLQEKKQQRSIKKALKQNLVQVKEHKSNFGEKSSARRSAGNTSIDDLVSRDGNQKEMLDKIKVLKLKKNINPLAMLAPLDQFTEMKKFIKKNKPKNFNPKRRVILHKFEEDPFPSENKLKIVRRANSLSKKALKNSYTKLAAKLDMDQKSTRAKNLVELWTKQESTPNFERHQSSPSPTKPDVLEYHDMTSNQIIELAKSRLPDRISKEVSEFSNHRLTQLI